DGRSQWQAESGQLVMDFDVEPAAGSVSFLKHRVPAPAPVSKEAERSEKEVERTDAAATWFERGEALEASDDHGAEAAYRTALALDPGHADASLNLGALLWEGKRLDEAVALYDKALRRHPNEALLHFNRALALEDQGRLMEALHSYNTSLGLAPDLADAHYNAARLHEQLGDARKAVRHLSAYRRLQRR
ncbi:MAG: tetratricopeptide repeat protein, partial [Caldimonas sp.]